MNTTIFAFIIGIFAGIMIGLKLENRFSLYKYLEEKAKKNRSSSRRNQPKKITMPKNIDFKR